MEGLEHRSQYRLNVLPQDTSGLVERSSEVGSSEVVVVAVAVLKGRLRTPASLAAKKSKTYEVGKGGSVDHVVAVGIVGTRATG
jgi:hypothetical protein